MAQDLSNDLGSLSVEVWSNPPPPILSANSLQTMAATLHLYHLMLDFWKRNLSQVILATGTKLGRYEIRAKIAEGPILQLG